MLASRENQRNKRLHCREKQHYNETKLAMLLAHVVRVAEEFVFVVHSGWSSAPARCIQEKDRTNQFTTFLLPVWRHTDDALATLPPTGQNTPNPNSDKTQNYNKLTFYITFYFYCTTFHSLTMYFFTPDFFTAIVTLMTIFYNKT